MKKPRTNPKVVNESGGKYDLQLFYDTYMRYIELSKYLFASKEPIYDINEMPENCKFYEAATVIARQLKINWRTMSHEDSNRIMLALLEDTYNAMLQVSRNKELAIDVTLKILNKNKL